MHKRMRYPIRTAEFLASFTRVNIHRVKDNILISTLLRKI